MRIAFYAPLKSPTHGTPSGDRRVAGLLMDALRVAGHDVELVSAFRSFEGSGDADSQARLRTEGVEIARTLVDRWREIGECHRPEMWFTYHLYYKAPDWLGPIVTAALGIPYVIAEASHAPKRAGGPWAIGHEATRDAIQRAALVLSPTNDDVACLEVLVSSPSKILFLPPFLDVAPYSAVSGSREAVRAQMSSAHHLDAAVPWIIVVAMMRPGDKLGSYRMLALALTTLRDLPWQLVVVGDGSARPEVEAALFGAASKQVRFLGERSNEDLAAIYSACDLYVWPAVNEAYGMAMLEAQAAGLPVVSRAVRGVPDVVRDGQTGLLAARDDVQGLSALTRALLSDSTRRARMGHAARHYVHTERCLEATAARLNRAFESLPDGTTPSIAGTARA